MSFDKETDLCAAFIQAVKDEDRYASWEAYPETEGFDILMVRKKDGIQVGIEAKLVFNAKVLAQVLPKYPEWNAGGPGPHYRAVLVPDGKSRLAEGLGTLAGWLGITVLRVYRSTASFGIHSEHFRYTPRLPSGMWEDGHWHEWCPHQLCTVPDYVPDVAAGASAPRALTPWKVKAIKLAIIMESRPVTGADFSHLKLSPSRWTQFWLKRAPDGSGWIPGPDTPDFKLHHPRNYEEIRANAADWMPKEEK